MPSKDRPKDVRVEPNIYRTPHGWRVYVKRDGVLKPVRFKRDVTLEQLRIFVRVFGEETERLRRKRVREQAPERRSLADLKRVVQERIDRFDARFGRKRRLAIPENAATVEPRRRTVARQTTGQRIDALRRECGWSYEALAEEAEVEKSTVARNITGKRKPRVSVLQAYASAFARKLDRAISPRDLSGS